MLGFIGLIVIGLVLLYFGAEGLVKGSASLAMRLGMSSLAIGLTIVAYGTSMPELVVSAKAAVQHQGAISIGNVVGSNIFNIAVILGIAALVYPMKVKLKIVKYDTPIMIGVAFLFLLLFQDGVIGRFEGFFLTIGILVFTVANLILARKTGRSVEDQESSYQRLRSIWMEMAYIAGGLVLLVIGSNLLVKGSVGIATLAGISEAVIGLTIVAMGTSLPELSTSLVAAFRKEADIAIANVVGSNIFNLTGILGVSSLISPIEGQGIGMSDGIVMLVLSLLLLPLLRTGFVLGRIEGVFLLGIYAVYLGFLIAG